MLLQHTDSIDIDIHQRGHDRSYAQVENDRRTRTGRRFRRSAKFIFVSSHERESNNNKLRSTNSGDQLFFWIFEIKRSIRSRLEKSNPYNRT